MNAVETLKSYTEALIDGDIERASGFRDFTREAEKILKLRKEKYPDEDLEPELFDKVAEILRDGYIKEYREKDLGSLKDVVIQYSEDEIDDETSIIAQKFIYSDGTEADEKVLLKRNGYGRWCIMGPTN